MDETWNRSQKYHRRARYLYALLFPNKRLYIGQSVDPKRRFQQHMGTWHTSDFEMVVLSCHMTTEAEAADLEHGYRQAAAWWGWRVYSMPPGFLIRNVGLQMNAQRRRLARRLWWRFLGQKRRGVRYGPADVRRR